MINRIVRLSFKPEMVNDFLNVFNESKHQIAAFKGCHGLTLLQDVNFNNVFFTYSLWENEDCLNKYRYSDLFKETWTKTKRLFNDKPIAYSLLVTEVVK
jgi:quinol monooxygenase YgiN